MSAWVLGLGVIMAVATLAKLAWPREREDDDDEYTDVSGWGTGR